MTRYWLLKSEPSAYSWEQMVADGETRWDGVRSNPAVLNLRAMAIGDMAVFYHSGDAKAAVGLVEVVRPAYPDPTDETGRFVAVDVRAVRPLPHPVPLKAMKADKRLEGMDLFRLSRLSVVAVRPEHWAVIREMARTPGAGTD